ncbi:helix-turn-helix domain-containing protein [Nocardiopsis sp. CC223A]|uniref:helix-turn-helix domain-containing protein n=1 Tax=Nocardiopsis sp. CC223A TaxID=3044051 RepID=UPI00278BB5A9|nr:helix-turn-helix domain-containing protein [Nocardiopsis sp. CC223A]
MIRFLRHHVRDLSQEALARMCGVAQSTIARAEAGHGLTDRRKAIEALRGLGAPLKTEGPHLPQPRAISSTESPTPKADIGTEAGVDGSAALGSLWRNVVEGTTAEAVTAFRLADRRAGGGHLYTLVMRYLSSRVGPALVSESGTPTTFIAAAGLTEMAGWMAHDAGRDDVAANHFQRALNLARAGEAGSLTAQIWASRAHLALHRDDTENALLAAEQAWRQLDGTEDTALRGRALAMLTRAHAARGDATTARTFLRQGEHLLSVPISPPASEWTSPFDLASLASEAARSMCDLDDHTAAVEHAHHALNLRSPERVRARVLASLTLARALIGHHKVDEAASLVAEAGTAIAEVGSAVASARFQEVRAALASYRNVPAVATVLSQTGKAPHGSPAPTLNRSG